MKWLKNFEAQSQYKDILIGKVKISDRRMFNSLVLNFVWHGKKKLVDYDTLTKSFRRCSLDLEACDFLIQTIEEHQKVLIDTYNQSVYNGLEKSLGYYFINLKKKSEGQKNNFKKLNNIPIFFKTYKGSSHYLFATKIEKDGENLTIWVEDFVEALDESIHISKDIFKFGEEDIHFWSYYTKRSSKFQDDVRYSQDLFNLIKNNTKELPPFITPSYFEELGWKVRSERFFGPVQGIIYELHENNQILIVKEDKRIVFDFDTYKAILYDKNLEKIEEKFIKTKNDLNFFE